MWSPTPLTKLLPERIFMLPHSTFHLLDPVNLVPTSDIISNFTSPAIKIDLASQRNIIEKSIKIILLTKRCAHTNDCLPQRLDIRFNTKHETKRYPYALLNGREYKIAKSQNDANAEAVEWRTGASVVFGCALALARVPPAPMRLAALWQAFRPARMANENYFSPFICKISHIK